MSLKDINAAASFVGAELDSDAIVMFGATIDDTAKDEVTVTVIATGLDESDIIGPSAIIRNDIRVIQGGTPEPLGDVVAAAAATPPPTPLPQPTLLGEEPEPDVVIETPPPAKKESNFTLINEDITPPFLRDWKKRSER
jgi:hypothetical protein